MQAEKLRVGRLERTVRRAADCCISIEPSKVNLRRQFAFDLCDRKSFLP
jgi:hypothetical protein